MVASDKSEEVDVKESEQGSKAKAEEEEHQSVEDLEVEDITAPVKEEGEQR